MRTFKRGEIIKVKSVWSHISPIEIWHYGVVVGEDEVVHFNLSEYHDICIIKTNLEKFMNGGSCLKRCNISDMYKNFSDDEIADRAESMIGSYFGGYHLKNNNCEHFANWCASGMKFSNQILITDEGESHSQLDKVFMQTVAEPTLDALDKLNEKTDEVLDNAERVINKILDYFMK